MIPIFLHSPIPRFHALLIAINKYKHGGTDKLRHLTGCIPDADDMMDFLIKDLRVARTSITYLRDEEATRAKILSSIRSLSLNPEIQHGDPILIYFAGHGATALPPKGWHAGGHNSYIQMLVPYDFDSSSCDPTTQGFCDITFGRVLSELARVKGDNIVCASMQILAEISSLNST
jgi:hypothetical protein